MAKKDYENWDKKALIAKITALKKRKKFGLVWEKKPERVVERCNNELPVLEEVRSLALNGAGDAPTNLLIEGDNYHALAVLNYTHKGKIDVIYIDPPYNTGAKDWKYNNDFVDANDDFRHSKWLSMMAHRLTLTKNLLTPSGVICIAIDHNELFTLGVLCDELFGEENRLGVITVVHSPRGKSDAIFFSTTNEYVLIYARRKENAEIIPFALNDEELINKYDKEDEISRYVERPFMRTSSNSFREDRPNMYYPIYVNPNDQTLHLISSNDYVEVLPTDSNNEKRVWSWGKDSFLEKKDTELIVKKVRGEFKIFSKSRFSGTEGSKARTVWKQPKYDAVSHGTNVLTKLIGRGKFDYPKSVYAVLDFLKITSPKNGLILDFFAGSGTTGHAVSLLNKEDGGNRRFILCTNNENGIAREVCYPRIKTVIKGHKDLPDITGIPSNLRYFKTAFVPSRKIPTDQDKIRLTEKAAEMICVREGTFASVKETKAYKIFRNGNRHTAILYDEAAIPQIKKIAAKTKGKFAVYIFSLSDDNFAEEFADMRGKIQTRAIPEAILRVYRRIFGRAK